MNINIKIGNKTVELKTEEKNILKALTENYIFINAYCGGKGLCGKCKIKYLSTPPPMSNIENRKLSNDELQKGFRLACLHTFKDGDIVEISEAIPTVLDIESSVCADTNDNYIALDIGTTTISISLINNNRLQSTINILNPQVSLGGDVLSRISYSNEYSHTLLSNILNDRLKKILHKLMKNSNIQSIRKMVVAANPTMLSFFLGYDPKSIGTYPYTPPFLGSKLTYWNKIKTYIPPVISAFIGSDITAGLINSNLNMRENLLFMDIGTNCEFILKYKNKIYAASVPGGPALEGAGIDYGMMAQEGAIEKVEYNGIFKCHTIGKKQAKGIAGSGLISAIALLNRYGIIDKNGKIYDPWEGEDIPLPLLNRIKKEGFLLENNIYLTQHSIREFQLVKGALNAGVDILIEKTGCNMDDIDKIYISGGFTKSLAKEDITNSNLLHFDKGFVFLGNSALKGAMQLFCRKNMKKLESLSKNIQYVEIANEENFQELYIRYMEFS